MTSYAFHFMLPTMSILVEVTKALIGNITCWITNGSNKGTSEKFLTGKSFERLSNFLNGSKDYNCL